MSLHVARRQTPGSIVLKNVSDVARPLVTPEHQRARGGGELCCCVSLHSNPVSRLTQPRECIFHSQNIATMHGQARKVRRTANA